MLTEFPKLSGKSSRNFTAQPNHQHAHCKECRPDVSANIKKSAGWAKGLTYEQMYGFEKAAELKEIRSKHFSGRAPWTKGLTKETSPILAKSGLKISQALKGRPKSPEHIAKLAALHRGHNFMTTERRKEIANKHNSFDLPNCRCYVHGAARPYMVSSYTWMLCDVLEALGFELIIPEAQFGLYRVDALLGEEWVAFEADGNYHFTTERRSYDAQRDANLLKRFDLPVIRLTGSEVEQLFKELV